MSLNKPSKAIGLEEGQRLIQIPCPELLQLIGQALAEMRQANSPSLKAQAESTVSSLEALYERQCEGKKPNRAQLADPIGAHASIRFTNEAVFLNLVTEQGSMVTVILGGSDGDLITIDGKGTIRVLPPEGPGDPEVRQAVASILQAVNVINGTAAAAT
jgi:hypothetical protein